MARGWGIVEPWWAWFCILLFHSLVRRLPFPDLVSPRACFQSVCVVPTHSDNTTTGNSPRFVLGTQNKSKTNKDKYWIYPKIKRRSINKQRWATNMFELLNMHLYYRSHSARDLLLCSGSAVGRRVLNWACYMPTRWQKMCFCSSGFVKRQIGLASSSASSSASSLNPVASVKDACHASIRTLVHISVTAATFKIDFVLA